eukprot:8025157-Pyramimonas_sp.AAC.1
MPQLDGEQTSPCSLRRGGASDSQGGQGPRPLEDGSVVEPMRQASSDAAAAWTARASSSGVRGQ